MSPRIEMDKLFTKLTKDLTKHRKVLFFVLKPRDTAYECVEEAMVMALLPGRKLGSRTLRLGDKGSDVDQLHAFLRRQGYDLGSEAGFGYLTKDAVKRWQRDHGLVADGIAGKRFYALALKADPPVRRRVHVVGSNETLQQIAGLYEVGQEAFGNLSAQQKVYPGQRLVFFEREIWGMCTNTPQGKLPLTGFVCPGRPAASLPGPYVLRPASGGDADIVQVHHQLRTPGRRKQTAQQFLEAMGGAGCLGLYLPYKAVAPLDGRRYLKLLKRLRRQLKPPAMLWAELGPDIPGWKIWGGVDYFAVNQLVDRVVLDLPPPAQPGPLFERQRGEKLVESLLPCIHSWKILLKVPVYALEWKLDAEEGRQERGKLPYQTALSRAFRHGASLLQDEGGFPYYRYKKRGIDYQVRLLPHSFLAEVSAIANRHNLAGLILDELGMEDSRIWQSTNRYFRTASWSPGGETSAEYF